MQIMFVPFCLYQVLIKDQYAKILYAIKCDCNSNNVYLNIKIRYYLQLNYKLLFVLFAYRNMQMMTKKMKLLLENE